MIVYTPIDSIMENIFVTVSEYGTEKKYVPLHDETKSFDRYVRISDRWSWDDTVSEDTARKAILGAEEVFVKVMVDKA